MESAKRLRRAERENLEEALLKCFTIQRDRNFPVSRPMLQAKANEFDEKFEEKDFVCSNGLLDRWKKRNNISCGKIIGEAANVSATDMEIWKSQVWTDLTKEHEEKDIFNADAKGLFYKAVPDQTLKFKGEK